VLVTGSKFTIASTRSPGQYFSRIVLGFHHNGPNEPSDYTDEGTATVTMAKQFLQRSLGGVKGIIVDGVLQGENVTKLQRSWITVVNYTTAKSNPNRAKDGNHGPDRVEKSHHAVTHSHTNNKGHACKHALYWVGGRLMEMKFDQEHTPYLLAVETYGYKRGGTFNREDPLASEPCRESTMVRINCPMSTEPVVTRLSMFHSAGPSQEAKFNYGVYARTFAPGSDSFHSLYRYRNDAESLNKNLKDRVKYLPDDITGQNLKMIAACLCMNALARQFARRAQGLPTVLAA
jgi:hypothetical protein